MQDIPTVIPIDFLYRSNLLYCKSRFICGGKYWLHNESNTEIAGHYLADGHEQKHLHCSEDSHRLFSCSTKITMII